VLAALMPTSGFRCSFYRAMGYQITRSQIDFGTLIDVEGACITNYVVGPFNRFHGTFHLATDDIEVGCFNDMACGDAAPK
jgi:hypothetical protein